MNNKATLLDPTAEYCQKVAGVLNKSIKGTVDSLYKLYLDCGFCKADAIWTAIEDTQEIFNGVDLSVNFDGPMAT